MKALILYNPFSSSQRIGKKINYVINELKEDYEEVDVFESDAPKSILTKIQNSNNEYDLLLVSGGDGTFNEAVTGAYLGNIKSKILYIPGGTTNDVGSILSLKKNVKKSLKLINKGETVALDLCKVNDKFFAYVCAAGKFTAISYDIDYKLKKRFGRFAYFIRGAKELPKEAGINLNVTCDNLEFDMNCYILFVFNYRQFGGFRFYRKNKPYLNDGLMDFTFIKKTKHLSWFRALRFMLFGDKVNDGIKTITASNMKIKVDHKVDFNVDGEKAFKTDEVTFDVIQGAVNILVPKKSKKRLFKG